MRRSERVRGCGRSDGRHQLEHGRHTDDQSDDDAGEATSSRRKPTRQAHTARSTSAPMACGRTLNNDPDAVQELGDGDTR
ncbi:hypothetical protein OH492_25155 [Vibrio chagasii]|nr:hypothetical protein [Vibrio chagasii]